MEFINRAIPVIAEWIVILCVTAVAFRLIGCYENTCPVRIQGLESRATEIEKRVKALEAR